MMKMVVYYSLTILFISCYGSRDRINEIFERFDTIKDVITRFAYLFFCCFRNCISSDVFSL